MNCLSYRSPIGDILLYADEGYITKITFIETDQTKQTQLNVLKSIDNPSDINQMVLSDCETQLDSYFQGKLKNFKIKYRNSGTEFQQRVWTKLSQIKYGDTVSYKQLASMINQPTAMRAVGGANNRNNISIIVPCHRVIGADGSLVGYGGGLWRKEWLISHEKGVNNVKL